MSDEEVNGAVRRVVGFAALRRLRGMVDAANANDKEDARWAQRLSWALALAAAAALAWLAFR